MRPIPFRLDIPYLLGLLGRLLRAPRSVRRRAGLQAWLTRRQGAGVDPPSPPWTFPDYANPHVVRPGHDIVDEECPECQCGTLERNDDTLCCRGECGGIFPAPRIDLVGWEDAVEPEPELDLPCREDFVELARLFTSGDAPPLVIENTQILVLPGETYPGYDEPHKYPTTYYIENGRIGKVYVHVPAEEVDEVLDSIDPIPGVPDFPHRHLVPEEE
jgi:hypothetical protein